MKRPAPPEGLSHSSLCVFTRMLCINTSFMLFTQTLHAASTSHIAHRTPTPHLTATCYNTTTVQRGNFVICITFWVSSQQ